MIIGKVIGNVWATRKEDTLSGLKLMIVQRLDLAGNGEQENFVAADCVGSGIVREGACGHRQLRAQGPGKSRHTHGCRHGRHHRRSGTEAGELAHGYAGHSGKLKHRRRPGAGGRDGQGGGCGACPRFDHLFRQIHDPCGRRPPGRGDLRSAWPGIRGAPWPGASSSPTFPPR